MHELLRLLKYFKKYRWHVIIGVAALVIIDLLQLFVPRILKVALDELTSGTATLRELAFYFLLIMLIAFGVAFGRFWWRYMLIGSSRKIEKELRTDFYNHLTMLDVSYFDTKKTGDLMAHAVNDINAVRMAIGFGFVILVDIFALGAASLVMMIIISPRLTFFALLPFPLIAVISTRFGRFIHRLFEKVQASFSLLTERVRENLSGIRVVKAFVQEDPEIRHYNAYSTDYVEKNVVLIKVWGMFFPIIMFLAGLGMVIVLGLGGRLVMTGSISIGAFVAFIMYLQMMVWPMIAIGRAINVFQRGAASQGRLNRIFDEQPSIVSGNRVPVMIHGDIVFKNVSLVYKGKEQPALENINFKINAGDFIGVTGPIGSGKTSLVNLILRLYEPQKGKILIDGTDVREISLTHLRENIAFVPQDTFLFAESLTENIRFGNPAAAVQEVERVSRIAEIDHEIMEFPKGFATVVGERGITLSGGQKQRIALARALLLNCPILILDDAFSSVDAETERKILSNLKQEMKGRTAIVISHRIFAIQDATRIIVIDKGCIVEMGTHRELVRQKGVYRSIFNTQQIEMKLEAL